MFLKVLRIDGGSATLIFVTATIYRSLIMQILSVALILRRTMLRPVCPSYRGLE